MTEDTSNGSLLMRLDPINIKLNSPFIWGQNFVSKILSFFTLIIELSSTPIQPIYLIGKSESPSWFSLTDIKTLRSAFELNYYAPHSPSIDQIYAFYLGLDGTQQYSNSPFFSRLQLSTSHNCAPDSSPFLISDLTFHSG